MKEDELTYSNVNKRHLSITNTALEDDMSMLLQKRQGGGSGYGAAFVSQASKAVKGIRSGFSKFTSSFRSSETGSKFISKSAEMGQKFKGTSFGQSTVNTYNRFAQSSAVTGLKNDASRFTTWAGSKGRSLVNRISQW